MKHLKRWLSSLLVLCMTISMLPMTAMAEATEVASGTCGENLTWVLGGDGILKISGIGDMDNYNSYNSVPWYSNRGSITSVIIENGATSIGKYAFSHCSSLTSINIPHGVTSIGRGAFYGCSNLTSISIQDSVTSFGSAVFEGCQKLETAGPVESGCNIEFGWRESIPDLAFNYCSSLTSINIPSGVTSIGENAFSDCSNLTSVNIPDTVTSIGDHAFKRCTSLTDIIVPDGVTNIGEYAFNECSNLTNITIPDSVSSIGMYAFSYCSSLTSINIPNGVTSIETAAFSSCSSLTNIDIPDGVTSIGDYAFNYCSGLVSINIPNSVISIGENAFKRCTYLKEIIIPDSVVSIGDGAFYDCTSLTEIAIPHHVISIGDMVFYGCSNVNELILPEGIKSLGYEIIYGTTVSSITIPSTITTSNAYFNGTKTNCWNGALAGCSTLNEVVFASGTRKITGKICASYNYASHINSVTIPESVEEISDYAFFKCDNLTDVYYGSTEENWNAIKIGSNNGCLTNATIHYNSAVDGGNNDSPTGIAIFVRYFTGWDAENQIAYFDGDTIIGSQVTEETDTSFLEDVDSLVGQYVLVKTRPREDNMIAPDTLISIKPVETKTGTVTDADTDANTIEINDVTYDINISRFIESADGGISTELVDLSAYVDDFVLYHIYDGKIVGIETLKTSEGVLTYWNAETREIKITHEDRTTATYTLSELADADTVALLGETGYFEFDVAYITDSNSFLYQITRTPVIDFAEGYVLTAYFDRRDLSVQCNEELEFVCVLYYDGLPQEDWNRPVFTTSNENVLSVTACEKTDSGYCLTVKGGQPGTATVTVTDANSGAYVDFNVEVREAGVLTYSYLIDEVPSFYPDVLGDRETQTNFYNVNGLYVNGFPEAVYKFDGKYRLSFTVYNSTNMYGSVDVYDENGKWYSSQRIDKHTSITGLWDTAKGAFFLLYDGMEGRFISYTAHSCSTPSEIDIEVPEGGYFTISNNFVESPGTYIYNTVDFMMIGVDMLTDLAFSSADTKVVQEQTVNQILQTPDAYETFLISFKDIAQDMVKEVTTQGYGDAVEAFTLSAFDMFDDMQFDFMGVVELACNSAGNVAGGAFEKCTPPAIGGTLKGMFTINKYLDRLYQVKDVYTSEDKPYIRLYTPEATGGLTISGITVAPTDDALPDNAVLQVFRIANTEALIVSDEGLVADQYELYNICFTVNNVETQPNGTVTVKIPVPANYNSEKCIVLHQQEDGSWRTVESKIEQGFIVFEVDHFCQFAVVDTSITTGEYTPGDINGDGAVNNKDVTRLFQYLSDWDVNVNEAALDVNSDGAVNNKDLTRLFQYLSDWDVEIS